ncbi:MAG TPA: chromosome segregation protein SMC, partial [Candidatus Thermoplasmatota archaeon]|nr:chromosome segregation protein SMC [Candidatus Thermoplasmatota archaeon]
MHLREVQMENFKSFGRKLTVPFLPGFTGITGPNGSGKSNIGDAILFVLGPNTPRAIRAGRLTDLIFNGGQGGRPADSCQVSLVFDNQDRTLPVDADTVTLTRKVRRTPSADDPDAYTGYFYVNGRASQKKEFIDLLKHARISADGYNITQQGDVANIVNMTPAKRREILDDIAGITQFDNDLRTADARKAEVQANLERIGIVLDEIGRSLQQLDKERTAAQRYRELQQAIARLKGLVAWRRQADLAAQLAQLQQQVAAFTAEREKHAEELRRLEALHKEAAQTHAETEARIRAEGGEEVQRLQAELEKARDAMVRLEEQLNFAKMQLQDLREESGPQAEELRRTEKELERTRKLQAEAHGAAEAADAELAARRAELEQARELAATSDAGAVKINRELSELKNEHEAAQLRLHEATLGADRAGERLRALDAQLRDAESQKATLGKDLEEAQWQLKEARRTQKAGVSQKDLEKERFELTKSQAELGRQAEELEQRIRRLYREKAELEAAEAAAEKAQGGFGRAVEAILKARDERLIKGIVGPITELAKVPEKYHQAMQVAGQGRLQSVIVEDDQVAAQCIELLKRTGAGRATFLPLTKMVPGRPRAQALMKVKEPGCLGFALDLIEFNPRYQNAFFNVFGDTLIADTMQSGRRLMGGVRIVTLDGELFEASGAMTGGAAGRKGEDGPAFSAADRGRLNAILVQVAECERAQQDVVARLSEVRQRLDAVVQQLAARGAEAQSEEDRLRELEARASNMAERLKVLDASLAGLAASRQGLEAEAERLRAEAAQQQERIAELERQRQEKGQLLLKGAKKDLRERIQALEAAVLALAESATQAKGRAQVAATQLELVTARQRELAAAVGDRQKARERFEADVARYTEAHRKAKAEVEALHKMESKATGALKTLQQAREKTFERMMQLKASMEKVADRMESQYTLILNAKAKMPAVEEALGEAMVELKASGLELAPGEEVPAMDELRRDLRNQEAALDRLGPVNMRALEEFEAQSERQKGLLGEVDRLKEQRMELERLVAEITAKKKGALMEVFHAINENFREVYARASNGGQAHMELENPEDPFQGGLILKAQPPGKKVTRLEALSGGEKSLTSMAFIFAIQRYDPSPFYYFDEVDQNLDAVNSELLAKMVRESSQFAQFIVVSLRKITLKEANHVYGVTQSTPGQSEIIANFDIDLLKD